LPDLSRRSVLGSLALAGVSAFAQTSEAAPTRKIAARENITPAARKEASEKLLTYFNRVGPTLLRAPDGFLKHPSLSPSQPGKAYSAELWDWDTLWTARGLFRLAELRHDQTMQQKYLLHARGSLENFLDHQSREGRIPIMMSARNPDFFGSLADQKPNPHNQAKPVMAQLALLVADNLKDTSWLAARFDQILQFHDAWRTGNQSSTGLLVWGNDVAVGMDNDPTTFGRPDFSSANLLLNCLFYQDLRAAAELAQRMSRSADRDRISKQADALAVRIEKYCWDPRDRFYYTADVQCTDARSKWLPGLPQGMAMSWQSLPLRIQMVTGFLPLWCRIATPQQAKDLIEAHYLRDDRFRAAYGVRSLSNMETMYSLTPRSGNPSNWLGPVWVITNYFVWKALSNYGYKQEAAELADKTLTLLAADIASSGTLNEYYHPDTGAAISHKGFVDWNLLILEMI
jgi:putative isomerase